MLRVSTVGQSSEKMALGSGAIVPLETKMSPRERALTGFALLMLLALHVALFAHATLVTDSGRDLANAWAVGHGGPYSPYGPGLFGHWKLGPVWYWILSLPLLWPGSITASATFVGLLAAAKIPLTFALGRRLLDTRFGIIASALIALPGWDSVGTLVIAHTSVVESAVLACGLLACIAWQDRRASAAIAASLMLALALHAHPTTLVMAPAVACAAWRALYLPRRWFALLACVAVFLTPFLPMLLAEAQTGWPQATATLSYLDSSHPGARLLRLPQVLWALTMGGAWFAGDYLLPKNWAVLITVAHVSVILTALAGGMRLWHGTDPKAQRLAGSLSLATLAAVAFIALLRDTTPTWMTYCLAPFGIGLLALGGWAAIRGTRAGTVVVTLLVMMTVLINLGLLLQRERWSQQGQMPLPAAAISDIGQWRSATPQPSPWLSVAQFDAMAQRACAMSGQMTLHGELAAIFDFSQGVAARLHCPPESLPRLGGHTGDHHLFGMTALRARELGIAAEPTPYGYLLRTPRQALAPEQGRTDEIDVRYRVDRQAEFDAGGMAMAEGRVACASDELLVVSNLMPLLNRLQWQVRRNDENLAPLVANPISSYFPCNGETVHWQIHSPDLSAIDIVIIGRTADRHPQR